MSNKNQNPNVEEELKNQQQNTAENAQTAAESQEAETQETQKEGEEKKELTAEEKLEKELEEAQKVIDEQKDKYLRLSAEFDNFRKRTIKEKAELIKNGGEKAINAVLPILDDLERALQNMQKAEDVKAIYDGVELIYQKFLKTCIRKVWKRWNLSVRTSILISTKPSHWCRLPVKTRKEKCWTAYKQDTS